MLVAMTAADLTKFVAWGDVTVREIHGWNNQGTDLYIQLHQVISLAGGGTVAPVYKSLLAQQQNGFMYNFGPSGVKLSCLICAISTTELNYTAVGANGGLDLTLDIDSQFACDGTEVLVTGSGVTNQQVWAESAAPPTAATVKKRLLRVDLTTNTSTALFGLLYAVDTPVAGSLITSAFLAPGSATTVFLFGDMNGGFIPFQQDANYTQHGGCTVQFSDTYVAAHQYGGSAPNVLALYK